MPLTSLVCRTCLGIISEGKKGYSIEDETGLVRNVRNIREMIMFCFPEMDTYVSVGPSICETCLGLLINLYNFKIRSMKVENVIRSYIQTNNVMEGSCVDLNNVVRSQILEALHQKNWPPDLIKEYISKVDKCLQKSRPSLLNSLLRTCLTNVSNSATMYPSQPNPICNVQYSKSNTSIIDLTDSSDDPELNINNGCQLKDDYLSTLNLISCDSLRKEVSLVQSTRDMYNSSPRTRNFVKSVGTKLKQLKKHSAMPKCKKRMLEKANNSNGDEDEVLVMNFDDTNWFPSNGNGMREAVLNDTSSSNRKTKKVPQTKRTTKQILTPEETVDEILSKRRKLVVELDPSLPYLDKTRKLVINVKKDSYYKCPFCKSTYLDSEEAMQSHHDRHHKTCKLCNYKCHSKPALDKHLNEKHADAVKTYLTLYEEGKVGFLCYLCSFVGLSSFDLRDHRLRNHLPCDKDGIHRCPFPGCGYENVTAYSVTRHMEFAHDNAKKRECPLCNQTGGGTYEIKMHLSTHSIYRVTCNFCDFRCRTDFLLKRHMERKHAVPIRQQQAGLVYDFSGDHRNLTTNEDGVITLGLQPDPCQAEVICDDRAGSGIYTYKQPSLAEILCSTSLYLQPDREDDCVIVDGSDRNASADEDCMIVDDSAGQDSVNDLSFHDWIMQALPPVPEETRGEVIKLDKPEDDDEVIVFESVPPSRRSVSEKRKEMPTLRREGSSGTSPAVDTLKRPELVVESTSSAETDHPRDNSKTPSSGIAEPALSRKKVSDEGKPEIATDSRLKAILTSPHPAVIDAKATETLSTGAEASQEPPIPATPQENVSSEPQLEEPLLHTSSEQIDTLQPQLEGPEETLPPIPTSSEENDPSQPQKEAPEKPLPTSFLEPPQPQLEALQEILPPLPTSSQENDIVQPTLDALADLFPPLPIFDSSLPQIEAENILSPLPTSSQEIDPLELLLGAQQGVDPAAGVAENVCEVTSSNLLDETNLEPDPITEKAPACDDVPETAEVTSSANLN